MARAATASASARGPDSDVNGDRERKGGDQSSLGWDRNSGIRNSGSNSFQEWAISDPSQEFQVQELPRGVPWLEY
jgi:hypothetical protein